MTPEDRAQAIGYCTCHNASEIMAGKHDAYCTVTRIAAAIRDAVAAERAACARACEDISVDRWQRYKGQGRYATDSASRGDPFVEGQSHGADACVDAIRARKEA